MSTPTSGAPRGQSFTWLDETGSTNDWLLSRAANLADEQWVVTDRQTAGRGRRGRLWHDGAGNLMASVLVRPQPGDGPAQQLSFVAALALHDALAMVTGPARLGLKWPNDLLLDGAKLSGILLERQGDAVVIGFGANLAHAPADTERPAISLAAAGFAAPAANVVAMRLGAAFAIRRALWRAEGFAPVRRDWLAHAAGLGERIAARLGVETLEGRFEGLDADGALALRLDSGQLRAIHAGEVFAL